MKCLPARLKVNIFLVIYFSLSSYVNAGVRVQISGELSDPNNVDSVAFNSGQIIDRNSASVLLDEEVTDTLPNVQIGGFTAFAEANSQTRSLKVLSQATIFPVSLDEYVLTPAEPGNFVDQDFTGEIVSRATIFDTITVTGSTGGGFIRQNWDVDGRLTHIATEIAGRGPGQMQVDFSEILVEFDVGAINSDNSYGNLTIFQEGDFGAFDKSDVLLDRVEATIPFQFGETVSYTADIMASILFDYDISDGGDNLTWTLGSIFDNTALLSSIDVFDENGNILTPGIDFQLVSEEGIDYFTPVPIPAAVWLFGAGLGLLGCFTKRAV